MSRLACALGLASLLAAAGCGQGELGVHLAPRFAALLEVPGLMGVVIVTRAGDGEEVARASLLAFEGTAHARLGGVPAGEDLLVRVEWYSGAVLVARSREPAPVRLEEGKTGQVAFDADDLDYPDDDGDGAFNMAEVAWAVGDPAAQGAEGDAERAPPGFFNGFTAAIPTEDYPFSIALSVGTALPVYLSGRLEYQGGQPVVVDPQLQFLWLPERKRLAMPAPSGGDGFPWEVLAQPGSNPAVVAALCGATVSWIYPSPVAPVVHDTHALTRQGTKLAWSKDGARLYVLYQLQASIASLAPGQPAREIGQPILSMESEPTDLVDTGDRLIVGDFALGGLHVIGHVQGDDFAWQASVFQAEMPKPRRLALHPNGGLLIVADDSFGSVFFVDVSSSDPQQWSILREVQLGGLFSALSIDPVLGIWVYAETTTSIARIELLSLEVGWQQEVGSADEITLNSLAIAPDGSFGFVAATDQQGLLVLGRPDAHRSEAEPNNAIADVGPTGNALPVPGTVVGYATRSDQGAQSVDCQAWSGGMIPFQDDVEDLWRLEAPAASSRLVIALAPTNGFSRLNLSLFQSSGALLAPELLAYYPLQRGVDLSVGSGVFFITPTLPTLDELWVGVGAQDFDFQFNRSPYELIALPVAEPASVDELEPNNDVAQAQIIGQLPVILSGHAAVQDTGAYLVYGTDDAEDCFSMQHGGRIGIRLDFAAQDDLDLVLLDEQGVRVKGSVGLIGPGQTEYMITEPIPPAKSLWLVCVNIDEASNPPEADYTLTMVQLGP